MEKKNLQITFAAKVEPIKPINEEFTLCKVYVQGIGKNRNGSYMSKENVEKYSPTLSYCPVVGHIIEATDPETKEKHRYMGGHDWAINENWEIVDLTVPYGVVVDGTFGYEIVNEYGVDIEYLTAHVILWTGRYPELKEAIYSADFWFNQSMEINVKQYRALEEDSNYMELLEWTYSALCLLGKADDKNSPEHTEPCFISSSVIPIEFSTNLFAVEMNKLKDKLSTYFNQINEGGNQNLNKKKEEILAKYNKTISDLDFSYDEMSDEDFEKKMFEMFGEKVIEFSATYRQKREALSNALDPVVVKDATGKITGETYYWVDDFDDEYVYVERNYWTASNYESKYGRFTYTFDESNLTATVSGDFEEMVRVWLTIEENKEIQEARNSYSALVTEFDDYKKAHSHSDDCYAELENFKNNKEKEERDLFEKSIFDKYEPKIGTTDEFSELKKKSSDYSIKELEKECLCIVGLYSFDSSSENNEPKKDTIKFSVPNNESNDDPIEATYKKYLNK
ncbi:hypothetical protein [Clostridium sp. HBUAS56010]|uniref:hypothetical protein n=1 Tax=Clostridium sp. HBUAS56010 TaxID=2571127 RepID=UPI00117757A0|nr:hypothetical protein [Clostridium sp. HBUAS56010]